MNHLAHFLLSGEEENIIIGNFLADFVNLRESKKYSSELQLGFERHRKIDSFTDAHPAVKNSTKKLHPYLHKYSPVAVDIFYDYILGQHWSTFCKVELDDFISSKYSLIQKNIQLFPETLQPRLGKMIEHNFLKNYTTKIGLQFTFEKIDSFVKFPSNLEMAAERLWIDYQLFEADFLIFFPDIVKEIHPEKTKKPED